MTTKLKSVAIDKKIKSEKFANEEGYGYMMVMPKKSVFKMTILMTSLSIISLPILKQKGLN